MSPCGMGVRVNSNQVANLVDTIVRGALTERRPDIPEDQVDDIIDRAKRRIKGVGADQYERHSRHKFEDMPLLDLIEYVEEETLDLINYGVFLTYRLTRLKEATNNLLSRQHEYDDE